MNKRVNLKINVFISLLYQIIAACSGFILPQFFITQYGTTINGSISTISQITGFLGLLEAGMGSVASVAFYKCLSESGSSNLTVVRNTVRRYYRIIAAVSILICMFLSLFLPMVLDNNKSFIFNFEMVLIVSCGYFIQYYMGITSQLLLAADYKTYINSLTQIMGIALNFIISIVLIRNDVDVRSVKLVGAFVMLIRPIILSVYVKSKYTFSDSKVFDNTLMKQRWNNLGQSLAFYIHSQTDMIVIMLFLTVEENSVYALYMSIISAIKTVITAIISNYNPIIGRICAEGSISRRELKCMFQKFIQINNYLLNVLFSVTVIMIVPFMKIYSEGFDYDYIRQGFAICLCISEYLYLYRTPYNTLINVNGHFKETQMSAFIEAGVNIILSVILVNKVGIIGVVIGTAIAMLYRMIYCVIYVRKYLIEISMVDIIKSIFLTVVTAGIVAGVMIFMDFSIVNNYFIFFAVGGIFTFLFGIIQLILNYIVYRIGR